MMKRVLPLVAPLNMVMTTILVRLSQLDQAHEKERLSEVELVKPSHDVR